MKLERILEGILNNLAEQSIKAETHKERKKQDETAYETIREFYCDEDIEKIKFWDEYYVSVKRRLG